MPTVTELTIDRAKVRRGGIVPIEGCMCPLGHYCIAAGKSVSEEPSLTDYRWLKEELGMNNVVEIYSNNDKHPDCSSWWRESKVLAHNEPYVIAAFKAAGVTVTYTGEYK